MDVVRSIRIHLPDRPGALSSISTALAVHQVNIDRLQVVSQDGPTVIDDLDLSAATANDIERAIAGFYPDVRVETFDSTLGDPVVAVARGMGAIASARDTEAARNALVGWALNVVRADVSALLEVTPAAIAPLAGSPFGELGGSEAGAIRAVMSTGAPTSLAMGEGGGALPFTGVQATWGAVARVSATLALAVARRSSVGFATGELDRFAVFAESAGLVLALK